MKTQGLVLNEKEFMDLYNQIVEVLLEKYRSIDIHFKDGAKTKVWTHMIDNEYCLQSFLKEGISDKKLISIIEGLEPKYFYRQFRIFENASVGITMEEWLLDIYVKLLGFSSFREFRAERNANYLQTLVSEGSSMLELAEATVRQFYNYIAANRYELAWEMLSADFQARVWGKKVDLPENSAKENNSRRLDLFRHGYYFFRTLIDNHIFLSRMTGTESMECMVFYRSEIELPVIDVLTQIMDTSVIGVISFEENVKKLIQLVEDLGGSDFGKRSLWRLFLRDAIEFIWFECGIDPAELRKRFDLKTASPPIPMLFTCKCIIEDGIWKIHRLVPCRC